MIFQDDTIANMRHRRASVAWVTLLLLTLFSIFFTPGFVSPGNIGNLLQQMLPTLLTALGQMVVIMLAGLDLSVGAVVGLTTGILVLNLALPLKLALVVLAAVAIGTVNGIGIAKFRVHPIIMTMGTMAMVQGITLTILPAAGGVADPFIRGLAAGHVFGIHATVFWAVLVVAALFFLVHHTWFGLHLMAIGGDEKYAQMNGARIMTTTVKAYVVCSLFAALAGIYLTGRLSTGDPNIGDLIALDSIVAAALGGTSLSGGIGSVFGTVAGVAILGFASNTLNLLNVPPFYQFVMKGVLLIVAVSFFRRKERGL